MFRKLLPVLLLCPVPAAAAAQAPTRIAGIDAQIASAVAPLPEEFRDSATVLGYTSAGAALAPLRLRSGAFTCLADDPSDDRFHVACYHRSLEPFMARGRALRAEGRAAEVDSVRFAEIRAGTLPMPREPAALYSLTGDSASLDPRKGAVTNARRLYVVYIPFATAESTGLPTKPAPNTPWLMLPGTPKAHIMFVPEMR